MLSVPSIGGLGVPLDRGGSQGQAKNAPAQNPRNFLPVIQNR